MYVFIKRLLIAYVCFILLSAEAAAIAIGPPLALYHLCLLGEMVSMEAASVAVLTACFAFIGLFVWGQNVCENPQMRSWKWLPRVIRWNLTQTVLVLWMWGAGLGFCLILGIFSWIFGFSVDTNRMAALGVLCLWVVMIYPIHWDSRAQIYFAQ